MRAMENHLEDEKETANFTDALIPIRSLWVGP